MTWLWLTILSACTWRLTRFALLDNLLDYPRDVLFLRLDRAPTTRLRRFVLALLRCAFCSSIWIAAAVLGSWCLTRSTWPGWDFIYYWLTIASGAMVIYRYVDPD